MIAGSIEVSSSASGVISLDGPQAILGDLTCANAGGLTTLQSTSIGSIGSAFVLNNLTMLSKLVMDNLTSAEYINWFNLPALSGLNFASGLNSATTVAIANTSLSTLDGLDPRNISSFKVYNNNYLEVVYSQLANVFSSISIYSNGNGLALYFNDLIWAAQIGFGNVSVLSVPALTTVNGSLELYGNSFSTFSAVSLESVGSLNAGQGSFVLAENPSLTNFTVPKLQKVGGMLQVANNSNLQTIDFPALSLIGGALQFVGGNFSTLVQPHHSMFPFFD
jgi:hypothetical protein